MKKYRGKVARSEEHDSMTNEIKSERTAVNECDNWRKI